MVGDEGSAPKSVYKTVAYRHDGLFLAHIPFALFLGLLGLTVMAFSDPDTKIEHRLAAWILVLACIGWIAYALYRRTSPGKPAIELSPAGLLFRIPGVKEVRIPWREISAVETMDTRMFFPSFVRPRFLHYRGVTAVRISRAFYDRQIHVNSACMRGPGWGNVFFPEEKSARVALHHEALSVPAEELRHAVEERWKAFGPQAGAFAEEKREREREAADTPTPMPLRVIADRKSPGLGVRQIWFATKILILIVAIGAMLTNIMGYWQTESQQKARAEHEYWQAEFRKWDEQEKRDAEERRKKDQEWEEFWRKQRF